MRPGAGDLERATESIWIRCRSEHPAIFSDHARPTHRATPRVRNLPDVNRAGDGRISVTQQERDLINALTGDESTRRQDGRSASTAILRAGQAAASRRGRPRGARGTWGHPRRRRPWSVPAEAPAERCVGSTADWCELRTQTSLGGYPAQSRGSRVTASPLPRPASNSSRSARAASTPPSTVRQRCTPPASLNPTSRIPDARR